MSFHLEALGNPTPEYPDNLFWDAESVNPELVDGSERLRRQRNGYHSLEDDQ